MPDTLIHRRVEPRVLDVRWDELGHRWRPVLGLFETSAVGVSWATHFQMFFLKFWFESHSSHSLSHFFSAVDPFVKDSVWQWTFLWRRKVPFWPSSEWTIYSDSSRCLSWFASFLTSGQVRNPWISSMGKNRSIEISWATFSWMSRHDWWNFPKSIWSAFTSQET